MWDGGGEGFRNGDSNISTKVMDLREVIQYVNCLQFTGESQSLLEEATLHFFIYRIIYMGQRE